MRRRVVLHVVRPAAGGMREHVLALLERLAGQDFRPILAGPLDRAWQERLQRFQGEAINLELGEWFRPLGGARLTVALAGMVRKLKVDLIHLHGYTAAFFGRLAIRLAGRLPVVVTAHGPLPRVPGVANLPVMWGERVLAEYTDRYIAVSESTRRELVGKAGIDPRKVTVIYNGTDLRRFQPSLDGGGERARLGVGEGELLVGSLSRLVPGKGLEHLLQAAAEVVTSFPRLRLCLAGEGPARPALERQARVLGLERRVIFPGFHHHVPDLLAAMDVFVHPSLEEGLPLSVVEAMAMARPVIATRTGGIPEILEEGRGCLVTPGDSTALAGAITWLLANPAAGRSMGLSARRFAVENLSLSRMVARTRDIYGEVLEQRSGKSRDPL